MAKLKLLTRSMLLVALFGGVVGPLYPGSASAQTVVRRTYRYVSGYSPGRAAYYRAHEQRYRALEQRIRLQIMREQWQEEARQRRQERFEARRAAQRASDAAAHERTRQRTAAFRERDDANQRAERAERHLATAARFEHNGNDRAAMAMYGLAARTAPDSTASAEASNALDRLRFE